MFNGNSGRYRHLISILTHQDSTDDFGIQLPPVELFKKRCEVQTTSGSQLSQYGTALTSSIITVLMRYDPRVQYDHLVEWNNYTYEIQHIRPDERNREMVLTCEIETK